MTWCVRLGLEIGRAAIIRFIGLINTTFWFGSIDSTSPQDAVKGLMAGASGVQMASELLKNGLSRIQDLLQVMDLWLEEHGYESVEQLQGSMSQIHVADPEAFERANYMRVLKSWRDDPTGVVL